MDVGSWDRHTWWRSKIRLKIFTMSRLKQVNLQICGVLLCQSGFRICWKTSYNISHDQTMSFLIMKLWLILKLSLVCWQIHNLGHFLEKNVTWLNLVLVLLLKWSIVPTFLVVSATTGYNLQWYSSHWANKITAESDDFLSIETMY